MSHRFETRAVHVHVFRNIPDVSKATPIYQTSAFAFSGLEEVEAYFRGERGYLYTRSGNPNQAELAMAVAALEGAERGVTAASGMAAIMAGLLAVLRPGDRVLAYRELYGGTYGLIRRELSRFGIELELIDLSRERSLEPFVTPATRLLLLETIANPLLSVVDLPYWLGQARQYGLYTMVDNTFATPYLVQPIRYGADLVVHSATKYIGGHSDVIAGVLVGRADLVARAHEIIATYGASLSPFEAWLATRGLKTLAVRMERQCDNAERIAEFLRGHPAVRETYYPDPAATSFFHRPKRGAMVTFRLADESRVYDFFRALTWIKLVPTLAGVETSVAHPLTTSHRALSPEDQARTGITMGLVRLSVGIEAWEDIAEELNRALDSVR